MTQRYTWTELQEIAKKHNIVVEPPPAPKPKRTDTGELRKSIETRRTKTKAKAATRATSSEFPKTRTYYVRDHGREEYVKGEWVERDDAHWQFQARQSSFARVIEVYDVDGPTVIDHSTFGKVVTRGCMVCAHRDVARPKSPIRFGKLKGSMCVECHPRWEALSTDQKRQLGLFVFQRLDDEGRLPPEFPRADKVLMGEHRINHYAENWKRFCWAVRVLRSDRPEIQQPMATPFGFLSPGPIPFREEVAAEVES